MLVLDPCKRLTTRSLYRNSEGHPSTLSSWLNEFVIAQVSSLISYRMMVKGSPWKWLINSANLSHILLQ